MTEVAAPAGSQAVRRALGLLSCFHDNGPELTASDLARRMDLTVSTAHRLARTLVATGFLDQDERTLRYRLGPAVVELGQLSFHQRGLHLAVPELHRLAERTGATADLALLAGTHAVIAAGGSVERAGGLGLRRPLHSTALGKVLLAWAPPGQAPALESLPLDRFTGSTITDPARLREQLGQVRADGYALNNGESADGVRTLAVPVLDHLGHARFAVAARTSAAVLTDDRLDHYLSPVRTCAAALEILLIPPGERRS
ncbi:IclR family transcriptional regulator [Actinoplanes couchii]|uniref:IclR family transcriptional regulator n=1 Tax=Actinoplanes couchii TaxID=403638 RepID=A0ABQ3XNT5_9ACTN|nr:IclR family transcriptional regulator [Actinoplanes couchii]MDR6318023.1 DNA-binding IclR family transcriptional regulator [Actinoplanes couchii]GID60060.1 IclR family transcriptional regulator [Actinoplanes couchii]